MRFKAFSCSEAVRVVEDLVILGLKVTITPNAPKAHEYLIEAPHMDDAGLAALHRRLQQMRIRIDRIAD